MEALVADLAARFSGKEKNIKFNIEKQRNSSPWTIDRNFNRFRIRRDLHRRRRNANGKCEAFAYNETEQQNWLAEN